MLRLLAVLSLLTAATAAQAEDPQWLKEARTQEARKKLPLSEIKSADGWFKAKVPGKVNGKIVKEEGSYSVELDIGAGADTALYCEVIPEGVYLAEVMRITFENILKHTREADIKVEASELERVDAGVWGSVPYLRSQWVYRIFDGKEKLLAGVRQYAFEKNGQGVYCGLADLGYAQTLDAVMKSFADTIEFNAPAPTPEYSEISIWKLDEMNVGIAQVRTQLDADGDTLTELTVSLLMPAGESAFTQEVTRREWSRPDGSHINSAHTIRTNKEVASQLALEPRDGRWIISGTHEGKKIDKVLAENTSPGNWVQYARGLRDMVSATEPVGAERSLQLWESANLTELTPVSMRITRKVDASRFVADYVSAKDKASMTLERPSGSPVEISAKVGTQVMKMLRVHAAGSF